MVGTIENEIISTGKPLQQDSRKRMEWVDYAKGMAIILVVYRHSLVGLNRSGLVVPDFLYDLQEFVFNFRMPVFFVLSGIFLVRSIGKKTFNELLQKKIKTLLYPYLLWTAILITIQILFSNYTNSDRTVNDYLFIFAQPRELDHMWYLLALFNTSVLLLIFLPFFLRHPVLHILFAVCLHLVSYFIPEYSFFSDLCYHYVFLVMGALVSKKLFNQKETKKSRFVYFLLAVTPLFLAGQLTWLRLRPGNFEMQLLFLLIIVIACVFFYLVCRVLYNIKFLLPLIWVGKHSLYIYIMHLFVISFCRIVLLHGFGVTNVFVIIILSLILGIYLPIFIYNAGKGLGIRYLFSLETLPKKTYA